MLRDLNKIAGEKFEIIILGGGITGSGIAWVSALAGFKTLLIERDDFGGATSAGNFKTIHGGLRYLQHFDIARLRESVIEQTTLFDLANGQLASLPFLVPCYGYGIKGSEALKTAFKVYQFLAPERKGRIPKCEFLNIKNVLKNAPHLSTTGLRGGGVFYDLQMRSSDRFTFNVLKTAEREGATIFNYVEVIESIIENGKIKTLKLKDKFSQTEVSVHSTYFINATGNNYSEVEAFLTNNERPKEKPVLSKGFQAVLKTKISNYGIALPSTQIDPTSKIKRGARSYFILPWGERSIIGTTDSFAKFDSREFSVQESDLAEFILELKSVYPDERIKLENVAEVFGGYLPVESPKPGIYRISKKDILEKSKQSSNLFNVYSLKYTTFRKLALNLFELLQKEILLASHKKINFKQPEFTPIWGSDNFTKNSQDLALLPQRISDLIPGRAEMITHEILKNKQIVTGDLTAGEIDYYLSQEQVVKLSDLVFRRTSLRGLTKVEVEKISSYLALRLNWNESRRIVEVNEIFSKSGNVSLW